MRSEKYQLYIGNHSPGFPREFARKVYDNCRIFQHRDFDEFFMTTTMEVQATKRWEFVQFSDYGDVLASMAFYREFDMHVGDCLSVLLAFSTEPRALVKGYRWMYEVAKELGIPWVCYTKEIRPFEYEMVYRKVT